MARGQWTQQTVRLFIVRITPVAPAGGICPVEHFSPTSSEDVLGTKTSVTLLQLSFS
uniref:Uncharacterized protein n=1 Tax=Peronospora matthiolae TaxID=2874970 RepID=A0AAV1V9L8_9STRA